MHAIANDDEKALDDTSGGVRQKVGLTMVSVNVNVCKFENHCDSSSSLSMLGSRSFQKLECQSRRGLNDFDSKRKSRRRRSRRSETAKKKRDTLG